MFQGTITDWAYDGEVVYHEMVHALMHTTTPLGWWTPDSLGIDPAPGGLHEGFSDYLAGAVTGNAEMNLYAGDEGDGPKPLLNLDQVKRCGDVLSGEEHDESVPWSTALWAIRKSLRSGAKRDMFNRAVMRTLMGLGQFDGFERARELVLAELEIASEEFIDEQGLGASEASALRDIVAKAPEKFDARELPDCNRRVKELVPGDVKDGVYLRGPIALGFDRFEGQLVPAPIQFELTIPRDTHAIMISIDESFAYSEEIKAPGMPELPEMQVLLKAGTEPLEWTWNLPTGTSDAELTAAVDIVEGEFGTAEGIIEGDFPAGTYYLQLANSGADWNLANISFLIADEDGNFTDGKTDDLGDAAGESGCNIGDSQAPGSALMWVLVGLALIRRRR
jgi:hypothetical protein